MKRIWTILLTLALLVSIAAPAIAAQTATAATLRLEAVEGTATVKNASGKEITHRDGMRLYSGYGISTQKASYAYISLDETKAVKLDASSSSEVKQSGKKLEVAVVTGSLFFNVTAPVKASESLSIRTSTMVTGVRGTCGWIEVVDPYTTRISLLEGELTIVCIDPLTGEERAVTLLGGQTATIVFHGVGEGIDPSLIGDHVTIQELIDSGIIRDEYIILTGTGLTVEALQEEDVPGFVAVEVAKDPELQKKIAETTDLDVEEIIAGAEERLAAEETAAEEKDKAIQEALEQLAADDVDPLFEEEDNGDDSGSSGGTTTPTTPASITFTGANTSELDAELQSAGTTPVIVNSAVADDNVPVTVNAGQTLTLADGAVLNGTYNVLGTMTVEAGATASNAGSILVNSVNSLHVYGTLNNSGTILVGDDYAGKMTVSGTVNNTGNGVIQLGSNDSSQLVVNGTLDMGGSSLSVYGSASSISGTGTITGSGTRTIQIASSGGSCTIENVTVTGTGTASGIDIYTAGSVTLTGVKVYSGLDAIGNNSGGLTNCTITITDCTVNGGANALNFAGVGSGDAVTLNVSGGSISGTIATGSAVVTGLDSATTGDAAEFVITFLDSDGSELLDINNSPLKQEFTCHVALALGGSDARKDGYKLLGWATAQGGTEIAYKSGDVLTYTEPGEMNLYAVWEEITYTLIFDGNGSDGGSAPASLTFTSAQQDAREVILPENTFTRTGYTFVGWHEAADGDSVSVKQPGTVWNYAMSAEAKTLYAVWTEDTGGDDTGDDDTGDETDGGVESGGTEDDTGSDTGNNPGGTDSGGTEGGGNETGGTEEPTA